MVDGRWSALVTPFVGCLSVDRRSTQTLQSGSKYQKETCIGPHPPPYVDVWIQSLALTSVNHLIPRVLACLEISNGAFDRCS